MTQAYQETKLDIENPLQVGHEQVNIPTISAKKVLRRLQRKDRLNILDVRTKEEYSWGHIPGAILLPLSKIQEGNVNIGFEKNDEIIVHCLGGYRSYLATKILHQMGYTNLKDMNEGMLEWDSIGGPTET